MADQDEDDGILDMPEDTSRPALPAPSDEGRVAAAADSSPATGEPERDTLSLVRDVVEKAAGAQSVAASPAEGQGTGVAPGAEEPKSEPGPDDYDGLPFSRHPRFQKLISERKELLRESERMKGFQGDAERARNVDAFLQQHEVPPEDAALALTVMAEARRNPAGALERLKPWLNDLFTRAGVLLPQDLQERVHAGALSQQHAEEISRARAMSTTFQQRDEREAQRELARRQEAHVGALVGAATTWETERRAKDPNYAAKADSIAERVAFLQRIDGMPDTAEGVRAQLEKAYAHVNSRALPAAPQPRRPAVRPVTGGQVSAAPSAAAPKNALDHIRERVRVIG